MNQELLYQVSQKNVPLGEVCPSPKETFFWDTLYMKIGKNEFSFDQIMSF